MRVSIRYVLVIVSVFFGGMYLSANPYLYPLGFFYSESTSRPFYVPSHYKEVNPHLWVDKNQEITFSDNQSVCLIGFCIDLKNPSFNRKTIVNELERELCVSEERFHQYGDFLCGRYVCFYKEKNGSCKVVTDATAMRPVFYDRSAKMLASHAHLLAINLFQKQTAFKRIFYSHSDFPGDKTPFAGISLLIPNRSLEIGSGKTERFFPRGPRLSLSKEQVVSQLITYVGAALKSVQNNQKKRLLLALTKGFDSRTTLGIMLLNNMKPDACYTYKCQKPGSLEDVKVSQAACTRLEIDHYTVEEKNIDRSADLEKALLVNSHYDFPHLTDTLVANFVATFPKGLFLNINSNIPEIWRWYIRLGKEHVVGKYAQLFELNKKTIFNYPITSMYYWEQRMSPWLTHHWIKTDVAFDTFNPYNARAIISTMLAIPLDYPFACDIHEEILIKAQL